MTREQEIKEMAKVKASHITSDKDMQVAFADALRSGAEWADQHPHWISVDEELPSEGKYTVTINKVGFQAVRYYKGGKWFSSYGNEYGDITHWLPLPQAPEKGGEE